MKRVMPLLLALAISCAAHAAPATKVSQASQSRTKAAALLEKSARSYAKLRGLSMRFTHVARQGSKTIEGSGVIHFSRPAQAKVEFNSSDKTVKVVSDSKKLRILRDPKIYQTIQIPDDGEADPVQSAMFQIPTGLSIPLGFLAIGENPLAEDYVVTWENAALLPNNGVAMTARFDASGPPMEFRLFFDPKNALLRRVETRQVHRGQENRDVTTISDVKLNPKFARDAFVFTPPQGAREEIQLPFYDPKLKVGTTPYQLSGTSLDGQLRSIDDYRGKVVLLDFWATWCGPCIEEIPNLLSNYNKYHARGFDVLAVSLDGDKKALTDFVQARKLPWPQLFDGKAWKGDNATRYGVRAIPFTLLIGRDGKIAAVDPRGPELESEIQKALKQR